MKVKDIIKEMKFDESNLDYKQYSFEAFLNLHGFEIIDERYINFEHSDVKAYFDLEIKRR